MSYTPPSAPLLSFPLITTASALSCGLPDRQAAASASTAWGTANQARYVPFLIPAPFLVRKLLAYNGATTGGNTDMGIYTEGGSEVLGIAAAAQAGTSAWQEFDVTDTWLVPGLYYVGLLNTTTTGTYFTVPDVQVGRLAGVFSQAVGAATLPSPTATFAALDGVGIPIVGMSSRTLI